MRCTIWYNLCNLKNVKSTHGGVLLLVKLQAKSHHGCFLPFLNCTNGTKSCKTSHCLSVSYFYTVYLSYTVLTVYLSAEHLLSFLPIFGEYVKLWNMLSFCPVCISHHVWVTFNLWCSGYCQIYLKVKKLKVDIFPYVHPHPRPPPPPVLYYHLASRGVLLVLKRQRVVF